MAWRYKASTVILLTSCLLMTLANMVSLAQHVNVLQPPEAEMSEHILPPGLIEDVGLAPQEELLPDPDTMIYEHEHKVAEPKPLSPSPGDWVVSGEEVHEDEVIVLTGNLIVQAGGNLTLINCTILMNCTHDGQWQIRVESGGIINVLEGSNITAYNPEHEFLFYVYGRLNMRDSFLSECGYWGRYSGLRIQTKEGVIIHNTTITNCWDGVRCSYCSDITISDCRLSENSRYGVSCFYCSNITITGCMITENYCDGVQCVDCHNIMISRCMICENDGYGVSCSVSSNITIVNNVFIRDGVVVVGFQNVHYASHTIENNTVNGKPLYYVVNTDGYTVPPDAGQVIIANSSDIVLNGLNLSYTDVGVEIAHSNSVEVSSCTISNNYFGVLCHYCFNITIVNNIFVYDGITLRGSQTAHYASHRIEDNTVNGKPLYYVVNTSGYIVPADAGQVIIANSDRITLTGLNLSYTNIGVEIAYSNDIKMDDCTVVACRGGVSCYWSSITISGCRIVENAGTGVYCRECSNIIVTDSVLAKNDIGMYCLGCFDTEVHYCNIYSNAWHGLYSYGPETVDAAYCWWGSPDGPEYKTEGDPYDPEEVWGDVIYKPWLTKPWDIEPPSVQITEPEDSSYVRGKVVIRAIASDNIAVDKVEFYINGTLMHTDYDGPYTYEWDTTRWADGVYVIKATAYDTSGKSSSDTITIIVDNTAPTIECVTQTPEEPVEGEDVTVEVEAMDETSGVNKAMLRYRTDGGPWTSVEMTCSGEVWEATIPGQSAGTKVEYYVEIYDKAGNTAKSDVRSYTVASKAPSGAPAPTPGLEAWQVVATAGGVIAVVGIAAALFLIKRRSP